MNSDTPLLVGNAVCLDFANTVNARPAARRDDLSDAAAAWAWAAAAGLPADRGAGDGDDLRGLADLLRLRSAVWEVFDGVVDGSAPPERPVSALVRAQALSLPGSAWRLDGGTARPVWPPASRLADLVGPVADSAVTLLRTGPLERVGRCPSCRWLFLDTSRNGGRRWCSMAACGSRLKTARYSAKTRIGKASRSSAAAPAGQD